MNVASSEQATLDTILDLYAKREPSYHTGVQTTVFGRLASGWQNWLTKLDFVRNGSVAPEPLRYEYPDAVVVRRLLSSEDTSNWLKQLVADDLLGTNHGCDSLKIEGRFQTGGKTWRAHSEWSQWPADCFIRELVNGNQNFPGDMPLVALDSPYYPSLDHVLAEFFGIRSQSWSNYFRGQVVVVLPDFRARISKFTIALNCLRADVECLAGNNHDFVLKVFAENSTGRLVQKTVRIEKPSVEIDLVDNPTLASGVLMCTRTGDVLDARTFQASTSWREPGVLVESPQKEIEQILLNGESETLEFKERLDKGRPERMAKTVTAFANTRGGTIVFGVNDDNQIVGCSVQGMADTITNIIRSYCDPPPEFHTRVVRHEGKDLLLVEVAESASSVHTLKDAGPVIRANGTNRAPTSYELEVLFRRRASASPFQRIF